MKPPPPAPSAPGWDVLNFVGRGGMGTVWKARRADGLIAALKVIDFDALKIPPEKARSLFRRESLACLNIDHPNLVRGIDVGATADGRPFLALEFVEGRTLLEAGRQDGPFHEARVVAVGAALARALDYAHRRGLLHRDVKPRNVMLGPSDEVKLLDLGLVVETSDGPSHDLGTFGFVAPEIVAGARPDARADLFSLGATLACAATGEIPTRNRGFADRRIERAANGTRVAPGLAKVLERLLKSDPAARYASAAELLLDLDALAAGERPLGAILGGGAAGAVRRGPKIVAAVAAVALIAAGAAWWASRPTATAPSKAPDAPVVAKPRDPRLEAATLFLEKFPDDLARGRALVEEAETAAATPADRADAAALRVEFDRRAAAAADRELASRRAEMDAALAQGDVKRARAIAAAWPGALDGVPQARKLSDALAAGVRGIVADQKLIAEDAERLAKDTDAATFDADAARRLVAIDAELARPSFDGDARAALVAARTSVEEARATASRARDARDVERRRRAAFDALFASASAANLAAVLDLVATDDSRTLRAAWKRTEEDVEAQVAGLAGKPWCGPRGAALFAGVMKEAPSADEVYLSPLWSIAEGPSAALVSLTDADGAAAWLAARGRWDDARAAGSTLAAFVLADAPKSPPVDVRLVGFDAALALRDVGAPAPPADGRDAVAAAWASAVGGAPAPRPAPKNPAKAAGRDAFLADDLGAALSSLDDAALVDPRDAEIAALRGRVVLAGARTLPTAPALLVAFAEARRAWDLDPTLPAGPALVAEAGMELCAAAPRGLAERARPVAAAACEAVDAMGRADGRMLAFAGEFRLRQGRVPAALALLRRAAAKAPASGATALALARAEHAAGNLGRAREALARARELLHDELPPAADDLVRALTPK